MIRHIKVGDNLDGKTLYFNFPNDINNIESNYFIKGSRTNCCFIHGTHSDDGKSYNSVRISYYENETDTILKHKYVYLYDMTDNKTTTNLTQFEIPFFGTVTEIDKTNVFYQYIKFDDKTYEKVYAVCENMCMEETMTKEQMLNTFVGGDVVEIKFPITVENETTQSIDVNYPAGFNNQNTYVIGSKYKTSSALQLKSADDIFSFDMEIQNNPSQFTVSFNRGTRFQVDETLVIYLLLIKIDVATT